MSAPLYECWYISRWHRRATILNLGVVLVILRVLSRLLLQAARIRLALAIDNQVRATLLVELVSNYFADFTCLCNCLIYRVGFLVLQ